MSSSTWEWPLALANGQPLSNDECYMLLDSDTDFTEDLFKTIPCTTPKLEPRSVEYGVQDDCLSSSLYPQSPPETKPTRAQLADDLLQQLDNDCKQENFSNWLEEKVELPIFDGIQTVPERGLALPTYAPVSPAISYAPATRGDTAELLREFETVYGVVELTHLTPPQSPPGPATQLLLTYAQQLHAPPAAPPAPSPVPSPTAWPLVPDLEREMAVVEEVVRHSAAHLTTLPPQPSPQSSESLSPRSSPPSSPHSSSSADEDWCRAARPSRSKPYSRSSDDRRSRKKEQNKNAATRYRQKKKAEIEVLLGEEMGLRQRHSDLQTKCSDLQREIRYLKSLMRDLFKAKGLIK